jgi:hypothetical protein
MKWIVLPVMMAALAACSKPASKVQNEANQERVVSDSSSTPATQPEPTNPAPAAAPVAAATPQPKQLAPEGVYFLRVATRVETDAGILGVKRGAQLTKVDEKSYKTPHGDVVKLTPDQVTNDLNEARQILQQEQNNAAALATWQAQSAKTEQARQAAAAAATTPDPRPAPRRTTSPAPKAMASTSSLSAPTPRNGFAATPTSSLGGQHSAQKRIGNEIYKKDKNGNWIFDRFIR